MNDKIKQLHTAIRVSDKNKIAAAIKDGVFFLLTDEEKSSLLIYAIRKECIETTKLLIENGADAFSTIFSEDNDEIIIPIRLAFNTSFSGYRNQTPQHSFLETFLEIIPDISATDIDGNNLIHHACIYNRPDQLRKLIDRGIEVNQVNDDFETPLFLASIHNSIDCVEILIDNGATVDAKNSNGETPLTLCAWYPWNDAVSLLVHAGANVHHIDSDGRTPLFRAAISDFFNIDLLLDNGARIDATDYYGETPIFTAIREKATNNVLHLIERGAYINHRDEQGRTPLFCAVINKNINCVEILLNHGADLNMLYHTDELTVQLPIDQVAKNASSDEIYAMVYARIENNKLAYHIEDQIETCVGLCF